MHMIHIRACRQNTHEIKINTKQLFKRKYKDPLALVACGYVPSLFNACVVKENERTQSLDLMSDLTHFKQSYFNLDLLLAKH